MNEPCTNTQAQSDNDDTRIVGVFDTDLDFFDYADDAADIQEITGARYADYS